MLLAIRLLIIWFINSIYILNFGHTWRCSSLVTILLWLSNWWGAWSRAALRILGRLGPIATLLRLNIIMDFNLGDFGKIVLLLLTIDFLLHLRDLVDDPGVGRKSWVVVISTIAKRVRTATAILVSWTIHWAFESTLLWWIFLFSLINFFRLSNKILKFL